ncbi:ABC transporter ATP-binding protein [Marinomonas colpomeniae]|uniref:Spermidine/putrescine import ATP-binding protein PotA n=1 Tax=Marinomonas colpomeniae TaxID=2774408 RepID=A0ABR8NWZ4_9GAMM|nr:ABC transporter ATP-binding protein [Marinomonas colpomeniae]MBD5770555.1 ABC transporter ATP-binding protein [Marinomonas colpomeniae]
MTQAKQTTNVFSPWLNRDNKPLIKFENITKKFGDFTAVENFNLEIYEKEFFALLGSSGGGKSTVLRMLAGFEQPTSGKIWLDGEEISNTPPNERPINMMFQSYALFPHLNVWDNIAFGLKRTKKRMASSDIKARVEEMLRLTQLEKFASRKPHQISGGQRQRVALARSLAREPRLLLLDEPLGALDKKLRQETQFELMDIQEKTGTTFVIVTHDQEEAMTMASRVAVMDNGKLLQVDTPNNVYEAPNSTYVANFIGDINIIEGEAKIDAEGLLSIHYSETAAPIQTENTNNQIHDGQSVSFAVRPEKIWIAKEQDVSLPNNVKGLIVDIAYLGNLSIYHIKLESGQVISAQMTNILRTGQQEFTWDDEVWLNWNDTAGIVLTR